MQAENDLTPVSSKNSTGGESEAKPGLIGGRRAVFYVGTESAGDGGERPFSYSARRGRRLPPRFL